MRDRIVEIAKNVAVGLGIFALILIPSGAILGAIGLLATRVSYEAAYWVLMGLMGVLMLVAAWFIGESIRG